MMMSPIDRIVLTQFFVTVVLAVSLLIVERVVAYSALFGGLCSVVPGVLVRIRLATVFGSRRADGTEFEVGENGPGVSGAVPIVQGELWKYGSTLLMFVLVFKFVTPLAPGYFFGSYLFVQSIYALLPWIEARRLRSRSA